MKFKYTIYEETPYSVDIVEQDVIEVVTKGDAKDYVDNCLRQYYETSAENIYLAEIERISFCETF